MSVAAFDAELPALSKAIEDQAPPLILRRLKASERLRDTANVQAREEVQLELIKLDDALEALRFELAWRYAEQHKGCS